MSTQLALSEHLHQRKLAQLFTRNRHSKDAKFAVERDFALAIVESNNKLLECTPESIGRCIVDVGVLGVSLSPNRKEAYLIPYNNRQAGVTVCTLSISYMGMEQIAYRTGMVKNIQTNLVHDNDKVNVFTKNNVRQIEHEEAMGNRGRVSHAYCIATYTNGTTYVEVMDREQIMAVRAAAAKKNFNKIPFTWAENNPFRYEMYKKAVLRRAWKHFPKSDSKELEKLSAIIERQDPVDFVAAAPIEEVKGEATITISGEQIKELEDLMAEADIKPPMWDRWLLGLAKNLGYQNIHAVKDSDFDRAVESMEGGIAAFIERTQGDKKS